MSEIIPVITIDGPSGTGKGTISQQLAKKLKWHFLDSGSLYRVLALAAQKHHIDLQNESALEIVAAHLDVQFKPVENEEWPHIILEGEDVSSAIRTEACADAASVIAVFPKVRNALLARQHAFREKPGLVADGRDMGTIVFPEAKLKIFLDASLEERAKRRYLQLKQQGNDVSLPRIFAELKERDDRDRNRAIAPLKPAEGALIIDTTNQTIESILRLVFNKAQNRFNISSE